MTEIPADPDELARAYAQLHRRYHRQRMLLLVCAAVLAAAAVGPHLARLQLRRQGLLAERDATRELPVIRMVNYEPPPPPASQAQEAASQEEPAPAAAGWTLHGRVYDLRTLKPVPGVVVDFEGVGGPGQNWYAASNTAGDYRAVLPVTDVSMEPRPRGNLYARQVLHERDIPYRSLSAAERAALADNARSGDLFSTPLRYSGEASTRVDLFLAPARQ